MIDLRLLVNPIELVVLPRHDFLRTEPQSDLLLCILDAVRSVANVATHILLKSQPSIKIDRPWPPRTMA